MATVGELLSDLEFNDDEDYSEFDYIIDNNLRIITVPDAGVILGVTYDKDVNRVRFVMPKIYKGLDLSNFAIRVNYVNAGREANYFNVTEKVVTEDTIEFIWLVSAHAAKYQGSVQLAVNLRILNGSEIEKSFNTTFATANVLNGLNADSEVTEEQQLDLLEKIKADAEVYTKKVAKESISELTSETNTIVEKASQAVKDCNAAEETALNAANSVATVAYPRKLSNGRYDNASLVPYLNRMQNNKFYGIMIPKGSETDCIKFGDNAGIAIPTPGTKTTPAVDPYKDEGGVFYFDEVNGGCTSDGNPYIVNFSEDEEFSRSHETEDTCTFRQVIWYRQTETEYYVYLAIRNSWAPGYIPEPGAYMPDNVIRPYMLTAKYALGKDSDNRYRSSSGLKPAIRNVSHNSLINLLKNSTSGLSGLTSYDLWYVQVMCLMKYATKDFQKYMSGCIGYITQCHPTVEESGTNRVIISKSNANNLVVGSSMSFGTFTANSTDRSSSTCYDIFDVEKITKIEEYDASNSAVYFEKLESIFDSKTSYYLSTMPWQTGACDEVDGDGSPSNNTNSKEPCVVQGIEFMLGMTEVLGNVLIRNDSDGSGTRIFINYDSRKEATSVTSQYSDLGVLYSALSAWSYPTHFKTAKGMMVPSEDLVLSNSGRWKDGVWMYNPSEQKGVAMEGLVFGHLWDGSIAGPWFLYCDGGAGVARWYIGSRRSYDGVNQDPEGI